MQYLCPRVPRPAAVVLALAAGAACAHQPPAPAGPGPGAVTLLAGGGTGGDGAAATAAQLSEPFAVARDAKGDLFIAEHTGHRVRRVDAAGLIHTVAGNGQKGDEGGEGPGPGVKLNGPHHIEFLPRTGLIYIADTFNNRVRTLDPATGLVKVFAGTGEKAFGGDGGPAVEAKASGVFCLAFDRAGQTLYFADLGNKRVRAVNLADGVIRTVAGNGEKGVPTDGSDAAAAPLVDPRAVAADSKGNLYVLERGGHALRVVDPQGKIRTVAGTGEKGFSGDGGPALAAAMNGPKFITIDRDDSVLIVDTENHVIRRYSPADGRMTRVAGTGKKGPGGVGGPALALEMDRPHGVYVDADGGLILADSDNHRVVKVAP